MKPNLKNKKSVWITFVQKGLHKMLVKLTPVCQLNNSTEFKNEDGGAPFPAKIRCQAG
jgi:hypothetical protein